MFLTLKCHWSTILCHCTRSSVGALLHNTKTGNPADRQCRKTTSGRAGFPSAWLGPILSLIRNWLVYWSVLPVISHSSQLPIPPLVLIIGQPLWSVFCLSTPTPQCSLSNGWRCMPDLPAAEGGWDRDGYVTDWKWECFCCKRLSEIIKHEQRGAANLSSFIGGKNVTDSLCWVKLL